MITAMEIRAIKPNQWLTDPAPRGAGTLAVKGVAHGAVAFFRYIAPSGSRGAVKLGIIDLKGLDGLTLEEARAKVGELSKLYQSGVKDVRAHLEAQEAAKREAEAQRLASEAEALKAKRAAAEAKQRFTLAAMLSAYIGYLERGGKVKGATDARSAFKVHVMEAHPDLAYLPAKEITPDHIALLVRTVREAGKARMAGVLRSYLKAAFGLAARARFDSSAPSALIGFKVAVNPVDPIPAIPVRAGNRHLSPSELGAYLRSLGDSLPDLALRLALLAGGQRMAQLLRVRVGDFNPLNGTLRLWDPKGRRREPREHLVPLGPKAAAVVEALTQRARIEVTKQVPPDPNPSLFLSIGGAVMDDTTPGKRVGDISRQMGGESFNIRDLRRTVETLMASLHVNKDHRAHLLSHGLGGLQNEHYDRFDYLDEKRSAQLAWENFLARLEAGETLPSNVIPLRSEAG